MKKIFIMQASTQVITYKSCGGGGVYFVVAVVLGNLVELFYLMKHQSLLMSTYK